MIQSSGALFLAKNTRRFLFLQKATGKFENCWVLVGGSHEIGETTYQGLVREIQEEIGTNIQIEKTIPLEKFKSTDDRFEYTTFVCLVSEEFIPVLSEEHQGYAWVDIGCWPRSLHPGLKSSLGNKINRAKLTTLYDLLG